jgi:hypothetical protein
MHKKNNDDISAHAQLSNPVPSQKQTAVAI